MNGRYRGKTAWMRRRLGLDRNPMRRRSDLLQAAARVLVAVLFVAGCVGAAFAGRHAYEQRRAIDRLDAAYGYQVRARIVSVTPVIVARDGGGTRYTYRLAWHDKAGRRHVDTFATTTTSRRTGTMTLWVDHRGEASLTPHFAGRATVVAVFAVIKVAVFAAGILTAGYVAFLVVLNRKRSAAWAAEWRRRTAMAPSGPVRSPCPGRRAR